MVDHVLRTNMRVHASVNAKWEVVIDSVKFYIR